jgi:hypothetical protein
MPSTSLATGSLILPKSLSLMIFLLPVSSHLFAETKVASVVSTMKTMFF